MDFVPLANPTSWVGTFAGLWRRLAFVHRTRFAQNIWLGVERSCMGFLPRLFVSAGNVLRTWEQVSGSVSGGANIERTNLAFFG